MALPLLDYPLASRNHRVAGFEVAGEEQSRLVALNQLTSVQDVDAVITAAYRQIFNEQQMLASNRQPLLESQLRAGQMTVRDFIQGLLMSDSFRRRNYECNDNYRFAQMCIQRVLGREVYGEKEKLAWSIVLATQGLQGFVEALLNSEEYRENFGTDMVPYQRRRILPQRAQGEVTFAHTPRYAATHLAQLQSLGNDFSPSRSLPLSVYGDGLPSEGVRKIGAAVTVAGAIALGALTLAVVFSWFGWIQL